MVGTSKNRKNLATLVSLTRTDDKTIHFDFFTFDVDGTLMVWWMHNVVILLYLHTSQIGIDN